jgi:uncharacterized protein (UPF0261 family)
LRLSYRFDQCITNDKCVTTKLCKLALAPPLGFDDFVANEQMCRSKLRVGGNVSSIILLGTLDTKGVEYAFVRDRFLQAGLNTILIDTGVFGAAGAEPDIAAEDVARAGGSDLLSLRAGGDRGKAVAVMASGARAIVQDLYEAGRCQGALALGGTSGTSIASIAFAPLPLGMPKIIVSTAAAGDTRSYIGESDLILMPSVVDIAGINRISERILSNAAASMIGMVTAPIIEKRDERPLVAASMFGVTTPCVQRAIEQLQNFGYEVLVLHMTGVGGRTLETLAASGLLAGVLDVTTTELADELIGGVFSAGEGRLQTLGADRVPRVVSVGALDMVNFGPRPTVPAQFRERLLYEHNSSVTLMRTTAAECAELGFRVARRLNARSGATAVFLPLRGVSAIDVLGKPFHDPDADEALFEAIRHELDHAIPLIEIDTDINDPSFAFAMANKLHNMIDEARHHDRRGNTLDRYSPVI